MGNLDFYNIIQTRDSPDTIIAPRWILQFSGVLLNLPFLLSLQHYSTKPEQALLDSHFGFDYSEYSRKNWIIQHVCCILDSIVRQLVCLLLLDRSKLNEIKNAE